MPTYFMRGGLGGSAGTGTSLLGGGTALSFALRELVWIVYEGASLYGFVLRSGRGGGISSFNFGT